MHFFSFVGVLLICRVSLAGLVLDVSYSGNPAYESAFTGAKATWESLLSGYQDGLITDATINSSYVAGQTISSVFVSASVAPIDNAGSILAQAGPTELALDASGFFLTTDGALTIDSFDVAALHAAGMLESVVTHEIGHILGFGSLWNLNNVYVSGSGEFTGANATAAWQSEFGQLGTPDVELEGGPGTANGHWNEVLNGAALTGITDSLGRDMRDELMTGWANPNSFISDMTVASFVDIGFTATPVPEPSSLLALSAIALFGTARRKGLFRTRSDTTTVA
ncbi:PEP-CTERM sorting domain-containing protein [Fuerstiella marisgermanici]|uniref:Ice-binding protein C-terminal domain-containing protein n=1 Tax=Fuerstiella marisgermanici TaxID=1891926 RepID=A0A1P8W8R5_9PLAN|nr:PEP-CTERM sorting domain-containing protein [Fuerstiella marisgermanici]APZ90440.1 hypothetical protein Fuma_00013 [Fuerstiella marisgermanici]